MPRSVAVVTDSTAYLARADVERHGIVSVPLTVVVDGLPLQDGTPEAAAALVPALRSRLAVTTSRPGPEMFVRAYRAAAESGASAVVSVHLSSEISGTWDAAMVAADRAPIPVHVVDSGTIAAALGFGVLAAAHAAAAGAEAGDVAEAARSRTAATRAYFYVDTLDHLRRGGRINTAQAIFGSALAVKPLLEMRDGRIELLEKVRTAGRALARLEELVVEHAGVAKVDVAVQHLAADERAGELADRLRGRLPGLAALHVGEVGAVLGAHTGPGLLGVITAPR
ncbi:DegV family protein [Streptomyces spiramenti]|uniref:DegV family protein n=1 Tax=Streptomyces spiramenti TaxID=2720606 RepID=A0ABX1AJJ1_9ACTN|nr:DegV family protein [Streptomyces spiramenti]NJP65265.1 DegV family protein [Streptomyces spiramenti]